MSALIASTVAEVGVIGSEAGAQENASTQNSAVFNPALAYNSSGFKDTLNQASGNSSLIIILIIVIVIIVILFLR